MKRETKIDNMLYNGSLGEDVTALMNDEEWRSMCCYLVGGSVRDAIEDRKPRDLDIIIQDEDESILNKIISRTNIPCTRNVFEGYKLLLGRITIDIWCMKDQYAFKKHVYEEVPRNLNISLLINYDSLVYDMKKKKLYSKYYDECLRTRKIDFVGNKEVAKKNPNPLLSMIKVLETKKNFQYDLSPRIIDYVAGIYGMYGDELWNLLEKEYDRHYNKKIEVEFVRFMEKNVREAVEESYIRANKKKDVKGQRSIFDKGMPFQNIVYSGE